MDLVLLYIPGEYYWGCNSDVLNKALMLIYAYEETNNNAYYQVALMQLNYILGINLITFHLSLVLEQIQ